LCKRRASCRGENRKRARVIGVKRGRVRGERAQSPSTPTASHTLLGDAISGICENSAERGGEDGSAELLRVPLRLVAQPRRKLLKLAVACFISRLLRFQKLPGFFELDVFERCQLVKLSTSDETREFWTILK
jgi:hypothetical protein